MRHVSLLFAAALLCSATPAHAQDRKDPKRPKLAATADTNDADAYFDWGMLPNTEWKKAYDAFWWAHRLDPANPTYLYALYLATWNRQAPEWRREYNAEAEYVLRSKEAKTIDSLYNEVLERDPFAHIYYDRCLIPDWIESEDDDLWAAYVLETRNCYRQAAARYAVALKDKGTRLGVRFTMARALYFAGDYAGTVAQLDTLLEQMRARDQKRLTHVYQTKTMFEYMRGQALVRQRNLPAAREAYGRALAEDLAFYRAHSALARVALAEGDAMTAVAEMDQAVQLRGDDPQMRQEYAVALLEVDRFADAEAQIRKALELDPWFVTAYFNLAAALDKQKKPAEAMQAYREFLARSPKSAVVLNVTAGRRVKELQSTLAASPPTTGAQPAKP